MQTQRIIHFLKQLSENNNKDWMHANKADYQQARADFIEIVGYLIGQIQQFDSTLLEIEPKDCIFRINRDIRFSNDKSPYKTNMGASIAFGGKKSRNAGYYLHMEPNGKTMIAGGTYLPAARELQMIRQEIDYNGKELHAIIADREFTGFFGDLQGDRVKTAPKGYSKEHPDIHLLQLKSFIVTHYFSDEEVLKESFFEEIVKGCEYMEPLISYLNQAIAE